MCCGTFGHTARPLAAPSCLGAKSSPEECKQSCPKEHVYLQVRQIPETKLSAHPRPEHLDRVEVRRPRRHSPQLDVLRSVSPHGRFVSEEGLVIAKHRPWSTAALGVNFSNGRRQLPRADNLRPLLDIVYCFSKPPQNCSEAIGRKTSPDRNGPCKGNLFVVAISTCQ